MYYQILSLILLLLITSNNSFASKIETAKSRCAEASGVEDLVYTDDFQWNASLDEIKTNYRFIYDSGKRLDRRAYFDGKDFILPFKTLSEEGKVRVNTTFIKSVINHVEKALQRTYADVVMFPDMGHSHFFIPMDYYKNVLSKIPYDQKWLMYEKMLEHKELKILYHTAEQLKMKDDHGELINDRHLQWRFFTRNIVGDNDGKGGLEVIHESDDEANTARHYEDSYKYWGGGFSISASRDGCFPFEHKGKTYYFDISLEPLKSSSSSGEWGGI